MTKSIPSVAADFGRQLAAPVDIGDTTFTLNSLLDADGVALVDAELYGFTIDSGAKKEYVVATLSSGTFTGVKSISRQGAVTTGFAIAHRVGAPAQITNHAALYRVIATLLGTIDLDAGVALKYDGAPAQTDPNALATIQFVLDTSAGVPVTFNATTVAGSVGENVTSGDWVYFKETDGLWYKTDADDTAKSVNVKLGKVRATTTSGNSVVGGIFVDGQETVVTYVAGTVYYLSNTAGALATSAGTNSVVVGVGDDGGDLVFTARYPMELTADQVAALAGGGGFGTPSSTNKFLTEDSISSNTIFPIPTKQLFVSTLSALGATDTQFDITNPAGTTFRYTFDGTGTNPGITTITVPTGCQVAIKSTSIAAANCGVFIVTGSGSNYFEVTNASGSAENNVTLASGYLRVQLLQTWTKPADLKYVVVELVAAGGAGGGEGSNEGGGGGGGGGGYSRKIIATASLGATENVLVGIGGPGRVSADGNTGGSSYFGAHCSATGGGGGGENNDSDGGEGGIGSSGDFNSRGDGGGGGWNDSGSGPTTPKGGKGGSSLLGGGMPADGTNVGYGGGGSGTITSGGTGSDGGTGAVLVTEYYS